jgi:F-box protein 21
VNRGSIDVDIAIGPMNIEVIADPTIVDPNNFPSIGRYFKRFDPETCLFVSNIREEFPED